MLRKLIKYEFRATARGNAPLYLVTIVLALLTGGLPVAGAGHGRHDHGGDLLATFIVAVVLAVFRFRKNLLTDEGYVMFTLPVSPPQPGVLQAHRLHGVVPGGGGHRRGGPGLPGGRRGHVPGDGPDVPGGL